jgi:hypothetical protein
MWFTFVDALGGVLSDCEQHSQVEVLPNRRPLPEQLLLWACRCTMSLDSILLSYAAGGCMHICTWLQADAHSCVT